MATQSLDLVYELQVELGWSPHFAATAHSEYMRWLRLRTQSGDFEYCKFPPSRAVGTVWGLHRQWTHDYEKTCSSLGGFVHHFPPAMRMNIAREEAYAATLHTYKALFGEDPPSSHWGPAICTYKPLASNGVTNMLLASKDPPRALPSLRRSPTKRDASNHSAPTTPTKGKRATTEARRATSAKTTGIGNTTDRSRPSVEGARAQRRSPKTTKDSKKNDPSSSEAIMEDADQAPRSPGRPRKRFSGPSPLYILKPLRPGEKRKRGRPSFADYVLASSLSLSQASGETKKRDPKSPTEKGTASKLTGATQSLRRRKATSSPGKTASPSPAIAKKERTHKPFRRVARWSEASRIGDFNKTASTNPTSVVQTSSGDQSNNGQPKKGAPGPLKRPRGRPRKDGSWPVPRVRKPEAATKPAAAVPQKSTIKADADGKVQGTQENEGKRVTPVPSDSPAAAANERSGKVASGQAREAPSALPTTSNGSSAFVNPPDPSAENDGATNNVADDAAASRNANTTSMPEPLEVPAQQKQVSPAEDGLVQESVDNAVPSKVVDGRDIHMHDLTDKDVAKSAAVHDQLSQGGVFEQIMDGSDLVDKDRQGEMSNSLSGRDVARMSPDVAFPQSENMRDSAEIDIPLTVPPRPEAVPNLQGAGSDIMSSSQSGEKLMQQAAAFGITPLNIVPSVSGPLDSNMLSMGVAGVPGRLDGDAVKDVDITLDEGDAKKPFKRPRGRPRKDGSWPVARAKTMNEEAVERVKDIGDASLTFPEGPSGTV